MRLCLRYDQAPPQPKRDLNTNDFKCFRSFPYEKNIISENELNKVISRHFIYPENVFTKRAIDTQCNNLFKLFFLILLTIFSQFYKHLFFLLQ